MWTPWIQSPFCRVIPDGHQRIFLFLPPFRALLLLLSWLFRHACNLLGPTHLGYKGEICRLNGPVSQLVIPLTALAFRSHLIGIKGLSS